MRRFSAAVGVCLGLAAVCAVCALAVSCYTIPSPDCGFLCGAGSACPENYTCAADNVCHRDGTSATTSCTGDAGVDALDAAIVSPTVVAMTPADGAVNVARDTTISARFDQAIESGTLESGSFAVAAGATQVSGAFTYDLGSLTAVFTPSAPLPAGALITVQLDANITSAAGAPLVPVAWTFTTIDDEAPTVASSDPLDMALAVDDGTAIVVTFSEPVTGVDTTSFAVAAPGHVPIAGTIGGSGTTYTFTPTAALPAATLITVTLSGAIADLAGNALLPVSFSFTTQ